MIGVLLCDEKILPVYVQRGGLVSGAVRDQLLKVVGKGPTKTKMYMVSKDEFVLRVFYGCILALVAKGSTAKAKLKLNKFATEKLGQIIHGPVLCFAVNTEPDSDRQALDLSCTELVSILARANR